MDGPDCDTSCCACGSIFVKCGKNYNRRNIRKIASPRTIKVLFGDYPKGNYICENCEKECD